jgi:hypothetical protein
LAVKRNWHAVKSSRPVLAAAGIALIMVSALGAGGPALAARSPGPRLGWPRGLPDPFAVPGAALAGRSGELNGVFCTSADDCWAVGDITTKTARLNQVLHWTGKKWFKVAVPEPAGTAKGDNDLVAVRCTSASNCWAVGSYQKNGKGSLDQILHWTGKKWFAVSAPTPAGTLPGDENALLDVACTSAASCWAVGDYGTDDSTTRGELIFNQVLRWNGKTWSLAATPNPGGAKKNHASALEGVRCSSAASCWAVGTYGSIGKKFLLRNEVLHWTGKKWTQVIVPNPAGTKTGSFDELNSLSCTSAANCVAVGAAENLVVNGKSLNLILRWNGKKWRAEHVPNPDGTGKNSDNGLVGVTCAAASDCWAVGSYGGVKTDTTHDQALRWTGTHWTLVTTPNPGGKGKGDSNELNAVRCTAPANCWAVGVQHHADASNQDNALHWTGTKWLTG